MNAGRPRRRTPAPDAYCQRKKRAAIPKQTTRKPARTAKQTHSGANGVPLTITWSSPSPRYVSGSERATLDRLVKEHSSARADHRFALWAQLVLQSAARGH